MGRWIDEWLLVNQTFTRLKLLVLIVQVFLQLLSCFSIIFRQAPFVWGNSPSPLTSVSALVLSASDLELGPGPEDSGGSDGAASLGIGA